MEHLLEALMETCRRVDERVDQRRHLGLPARVHRAGSHRGPKGGEVVHLQVGEQVGTPDEDRLVTAASRLEGGQHLRPDCRMALPVFLLRAGQQAHLEADPLHG
jgi:hypothetical protein